MTELGEQEDITSNTAKQVFIRLTGYELFEGVGGKKDSYRVILK